MATTDSPGVKPPSYLDGGKRTNLKRSKWMGSWWVGYGKDESCQFEGPWSHMVILAAKILRHPATELVAPNLYRPDLILTPEQENNYAEIGDPERWPGDPVEEPAAEAHP